MLRIFEILTNTNKETNNPFGLLFQYGYKAILASCLFFIIGEPAPAWFILVLGILIFGAAMILNLVSIYRNIDDSKSENIQIQKLKSQQNYSFRKSLQNQLNTYNIKYKASNDRKKQSRVGVNIRT
ncbi:hypothetical protein SAMN06298216_1681 [Spirosomataceae bacterium TFI 002]|nr:hypothetical protein SAMN06298216_1681 [Spirosomataceae bacterium TFI 002]